MRMMNNKLFKVILVVILIIFTLFFLKDQIIKFTVSQAASQIIGAKVSIGGLSLGVIKQSIQIKNLKIYNPKEFPRGILVYLPHIKANYDLASFFKGKLYLSLLEIDLKEIGLVRNKEGKLNVDNLKIAQKPATTEKKPAAKPMEMQIDLFNLSMGRIVSQDYTVSPGPAIQVYDINLKKSYKNITSAHQLAALIIAEPMKAAGIRGAAIYGVSALAGVAMLPAATAFTLLGKDSAQQILDCDFKRLYQISLKVMSRAGKVNRQDDSGGLIQAEVGGVNITLRLEKVSANETKITVSARKFMLPKPETANGIVYQVREELR